MLRTGGGTVLVLEHLRGMGPLRLHHRAFGNVTFQFVTQLDEEAPFTRLKADLLQQHTLTKYQKIEWFFR